MFAALIGLAAFLVGCGTSESEATSALDDPLLSSIDHTLQRVDHMLGQIEELLSTSPSPVETGDGWRDMRDDSDPEVRALIESIARCRVDGYGEGKEKMRAWLEEWSWRQVAIYPVRRYAAYWADWFEFHCHPTDLRIPR